jgi:hypothetical protein
MVGAEIPGKDFHHLSGSMALVLSLGLVLSLYAQAQPGGQLTLAEETHSLTD